MYLTKPTPSVAFMQPLEIAALRQQRRLQNYERLVEQVKTALQGNQENPHCLDHWHFSSEEVPDPKLPELVDQLKLLGYKTTVKCAPPATNLWVTLPESPSIDKPNAEVATAQGWTTASQNQRWIQQTATHLYHEILPSIIEQIRRSPRNRAVQKFEMSDLAESAAYRWIREDLEKQGLRVQGDASYFTGGYRCLMTMTVKL